MLLVFSPVRRQRRVEGVGGAEAVLQPDHALGVDAAVGLGREVPVGGDGVADEGARHRQPGMADLHAGHAVGVAGQRGFFFFFFTAERRPRPRPYLPPTRRAHRRRAARDGPRRVRATDGGGVTAGAPAQCRHGGRQQIAEKGHGRGLGGRAAAGAAQATDGPLRRHCRHKTPLRAVVDQGRCVPSAERDARQGVAESTGTATSTAAQRGVQSAQQRPRAASAGASLPEVSESSRAQRGRRTRHTSSGAGGR